MRDRTPRALAFFWVAAGGHDGSGVRKDETILGSSPLSWPPPALPRAPPTSARSPMPERSAFFVLDDTIIAAGPDGPAPVPEILSAVVGPIEALSGVTSNQRA